MLIGMATIFVILCLLWLCLILFKVFFHDLPEKRAKKRTNLAAMAVAESEETSEADDGEIIAVLAAAIAAAESEDNGLKFRVVSFRRV